MKPGKLNRTRQAGVSYVEVLVAALLVVISLVPMMDAMRGATTSVGIHEEAAVRHAHLMGKLEFVLSEPFSSIEAAALDVEPNGRTQPSSYSDPSGAIVDRRFVYLSRYDGDNADGDDDPFTGADPDLIWIRVNIEGTTLDFETLVYR